MKKNIFENLPLTIVMTLISMATSWGVVNAKISTLEKTADKNEKVLDDVKDFRAEQRAVNVSLKDDISEVKDNMKELLKEIRNLR